MYLLVVLLVPEPPEDRGNGEAEVVSALRGAKREDVRGVWVGRLRKDAPVPIPNLTLESVRPPSHPNVYPNRTVRLTISAADPFLGA